MAVSAAPQKKTPEQPKKVSEKAIQEIINKGGKPSQVSTTLDENEDDIKGIGVKLLVSEIQEIKKLRDKRPAIRGKKITISLHDWIIEAIQEKITREKMQYDN